MITTEHLRELYYREPFEPFWIVLNDGRELLVEERTHYAISPIGVNMSYAPRIEDFELIDMPDIAALKPAAPVSAAG